MDKNLIEKLEETFKSLFPGKKGVDGDELNKLQSLLNIKLPSDFRRISSFYNGGMVGGQSIFTITSDLKDEYGIASKTLALRKAIELPKNIMPLYCEYGLIYMDLDEQSSNYGQVIYCGNEDAQNLYKPQYIQQPYKVFTSFSDFFQSLLEEEKKERNLD